MKLTMYQVDAFADKVFAGNPAAVCPLAMWLPDALLQAIARENNLSETAFYVPLAEGFALRWFTPTTEVDLCGHATLASAFVLYELLGYDEPSIHFETRSGRLTVGRLAEGFVMKLPVTALEPCDAPAALIRGLGKVPTATLAGPDYVAVYETEDDVRALVPDLVQLKALDLRGVIATAPGKNVDFVSRFFAPNSGIDEDPVTGSAHSELAPYWSKRLARNRLEARQVSSRGGELTCEVCGEDVLLTGNAVLYMTAEITIPDGLVV